MAYDKATGDLAVELANAGLRATRQRLGVLRTIRAMGTHPTALQVTVN